MIARVGIGLFYAILFFLLGVWASGHLTTLRTSLDRGIAASEEAVLRVFHRGADVESKPAAKVADVQHPTNEARLAEARGAFGRGDFVDAIRGYTDLAAALPEDGNLRGELGNVYFNAGRLEDAAAAFHGAASSVPCRGRCRAGARAGTGRPARQSGTRRRSGPTAGTARCGTDARRRGGTPMRRDQKSGAAFSGPDTCARLIGTVAAKGPADMTEMPEIGAAPPRPDPGRDWSAGAAALRGEVHHPPEYLAYLEKASNALRVVRIIVYAGMASFTVLACYGFFLIYQLTGDVRRAVDQTVLMTQQMQAMTRIMSNMDGSVAGMGTEFRGDEGFDDHHSGHRGGYGGQSRADDLHRRPDAAFRKQPGSEHRPDDGGGQPVRSLWTARKQLRRCSAPCTCQPVTACLCGDQATIRHRGESRVLPECSGVFGKSDSGQLPPQAPQT